MPRPLRSSRRIGFRTAAIALPLVLLLGVPELIIRVLDPPLQRYRVMHFGGDPASPDLFMKDPVLHWRLRPDVELPFSGVRVRTNRDGLRGVDAERAQRTVLCLGDSTTFGWRVAEQATFVAQLEAMLEAATPTGPTWRTLNAGVPGYTSFQVARAADALIERWRPDYVVVNVGNNESWPAPSSDRSLHERRRLVAPLLSLLSHSHFLVWIGEQIAPRDVLRLAVDATHAEPRVDASEYRENLKSVLRSADAIGARTILAAPTVNLSHPPQRLETLPDWEDRRPSWQRFYARLTANDFALARELDQEIASHPERFELLWLKGAALVRSGRVDEGRELLETAFEAHPFPDRSTPRYRDGVAELAAAEGVPFLDPNPTLNPVSAGRAAPPLFIDWTHPSEEGHERIARSLAELILRLERGAGERRAR